MSSEPTNADVLDAVAMELSRFSREVVTEVHRLRDQLAEEQQRVRALETDVAELRRQAALPAVATPPPAVAPPAPAPAADPGVVTEIEFAPLTLSLQPVADAAAADTPSTDAGLDDLVARVLDEVSEPIAVTWPAES